MKKFALSLSKKGRHSLFFDFVLAQAGVDSENINPVINEFISCNSIGGEHTLNVFYDYFERKCSLDCYFFPYFVHPSNFSIYQNTFFENFRQNKIFFAGSTGVSYNKLNVNFEILNRNIILESLFNNIGHLGNAFDPSNDQIFLSVNTNLVNDINVHRLNVQSYFHRLKTTNFFLALPGFAMPHAHNIVESICCGCIPITNYHNQMHPPLTHGENCLSFTTLNEFYQVIDRAINMNEMEISRMRDSLSKYYSEYLGPDVVFSNLCNRDLHSVVFNAELQSLPISI